MKRLLAIVLATFVVSATASGQPRMGPDLAITGIAASETRIGVGETFTYTVTARNAGNAPCNWVNLTLRFPGEVDLVNASSVAPLTCRLEPAIRIVGLPFDVACRGGPGFFLWPGSTLTASFLVRARRTGSYVSTTATADPGNVCFESNEANNKATSTAIAIIQRPILKIALNKPFPPSPGVGRSPGSQIYPVTITNVGAGPAFNVALVVSEGFIIAGPYDGPVIDIAYKGQRAAEGQTPPGLIAPDCVTVSNNNNAVRTNTCVLPLVLQPGEMLQVHYRFLPTCGLATPVRPPDILVGTPDDITQADHMVNLIDACRL